MNYQAIFFHFNGKEQKKYSIGVMNYQTDFFHLNGKRPTNLP